MPKTVVVFFCEADGSVPSLKWLDGLDEKVQNKFIVRITRLVDWVMNCEDRKLIFFAMESMNFV